MADNVAMRGSLHLHGVLCMPEVEARRAAAARAEEEQAKAVAVAGEPVAKKGECRR